MEQISKENNINLIDRDLRDQEQQSKELSSRNDDNNDDEESTTLNEESSINKQSSNNDDTLISSYADGEQIEEAVDLFTRSSNSEVLVPTFVISSPRPITVASLLKGKSRVNLSKGKRPRILVPTTMSFDGELCNQLESSRCDTYSKALFNAARQNQEFDFIERTKNTLLVRVQEMHDSKVLTIFDTFKLFQREMIPISMSLPSCLPKSLLSEITKIDEDSLFIETIFDNFHIQESMRKAILEAKKLPTCPCGYIFVHPMLTMPQHSKNSKYVVGKQPGDPTLITIQKTVALEYLNALRYFLEICYETMNN